MGLGGTTFQGTRPRGLDMYALAFCRKAGYRPELAWTCCDYADTLRERDADGDRAKASALLDESLAISSELGSVP